jgi:hypothetical protein
MECALDQRNWPNTTNSNTMHSFGMSQGCYRSGSRDSACASQKEDLL